jgi:hypothetical protein
VSIARVKMFSASQLISGSDIAAGTLALMVFSAGAAALVVAILFRVALRRTGGAGKAGLLWVGAVVFFGAIFMYALFDRLAARDIVAERRGIEARAAELTARAITPGSALGCLDAVANALVENACEKPLFATPETVAAALAYVDARFSLLAASATLAEHDPGYRPAFERLRQGLEADHYGFVAQVLTTRGCSGSDCPELKLLRDPARVVANMKARVFESSLGTHALAWAPGAATTVASASPPPLPPLSATTGAAHDAQGSPSTPSAVKFDYPTANSIPAVSIMNAEPGSSPASEPKAAVLPPKRPATTRHHQPAKQAAAPPPASPPQPQAQPAQVPPLPAQIVPQAIPAEPPPPPIRPDPHAAR